MQGDRFPRASPWAVRTTPLGSAGEWENGPGSFVVTRFVCPETELRALSCPISNVPFGHSAGHNCLTTLQHSEDLRIL